MPLEWELNYPSSSLYYRFQVYLDNYLDKHPELDNTVEVRYSTAMDFLKSELEDVTSVANENGKIDPANLDKRSVEMLQLYLQQQVCAPLIGSCHD